MTTRKDNSTTSQTRLVPKLRFREFDGTWSIKNLGEAFSIFNGYAFSSGDAQDQGCRWVKIADVGINEMEEDSLSFLPIKFKAKYSKFILNEGDFVVALTRPILGGKLKIARINEEFDGALLNQRVGKLQSKNNLEFIYCILQKASLVYRIENRIAGTDPPNLSPNEIESLKTFLPSLPEQKQIASFLSAVDEKIQKLTRKKELLEKYKKGVMQQLFSGKLRFRDDEGKAYPKWEEKKLGDICETFKSGESITSNDIHDSGKYPVYGGNGLRGYTNDYTHEGFFTLIGRQGALCGNINRVYDKSFISEHAIAVSGGKLSDTEWLAQKLAYLQLNRLSESSAQPGLAVNKLVKLKFSVPALPEQKKIADFLSTLDIKIETVANQIAKAQNFKKGLLQQMFV